MIIYAVLKQLMLEKCSYFSRIAIFTVCWKEVFWKGENWKWQSNVLRVNLGQFRIPNISFIGPEHQL